LLASAVQAHDSFIELYHRLNLDASRTMWKDARSLRKVLDKMLEEGRAGNPEECERLQEIARHARQNLEGSFRDRLRHEVLQPRKDVTRNSSGSAVSEVRRHRPVTSPPPPTGRDGDLAVKAPRSSQCPARDSPRRRSGAVTQLSSERRRRAERVVQEGGRSKRTGRPRGARSIRGTRSRPRRRLAVRQSQHAEA
jgi:hypothetical protein